MILDRFLLPIVKKKMFCSPADEIPWGGFPLRTLRAERLFKCFKALYRRAGVAHEINMYYIFQGKHKYGTLFVQFIGVIGLGFIWTTIDYTGLISELRLVIFIQFLLLAELLLFGSRYDNNGTRIVCANWLFSTNTLQTVLKLFEIQNLYGLHVKTKKKAIWTAKGLGVGW